MSYLNILHSSICIYTVRSIKNLRNKEKRSKDDDKVNTEYFKPGPDLDVFRNVDPDKFQWVNASMIVAHEITCGYLKAPFGWPAGSKTGYRETPDQKQYPFVQVCKLMLWCTLLGIM